MSRYDYMSQEELAEKCERMEREISSLERKVRELERENTELENEKSALNYKITTELEPRLRREKAAYDSWATDPERH